jgi:uncharacterized protein
MTAVAAAPPVESRTRETLLLEWLAARGSVVLGFSGGVDSTYLAAAAVDALGRDPARFVAVIGRSASYPAAQWESARDVARRFGIPVLEIDTDELQDPRYAANPTNRCYFCKSHLWGRLSELARGRGPAMVVDGTNADDLAEYRPGMAAAREHGVRSPLAELGFSKEEIRALSRARGLPTWAQPSSPCLSSRIPYGIAVTTERLAAVEAAERALRAAGLSGDLRVRHHGELARIEMPPEAIGGWLTPTGMRRLRAAVREAGFERVAVDLRGFRSGSLNVLGGVTGS